MISTQRPTHNARILDWLTDLVPGSPATTVDEQSAKRRRKGYLANRIEKKRAKCTDNDLQAAAEGQPTRYGSPPSPSDTMAPRSGKGGKRGRKGSSPPPLGSTDSFDARVEQQQQQQQRSGSPVKRSRRARNETNAGIRLSRQVAQSRIPSRFGGDGTSDVAMQSSVESGSRVGPADEEGSVDDAPIIAPQSSTVRSVPMTNTHQSSSPKKPGAANFLRIQYHNPSVIFVRFLRFVENTPQSGLPSRMLTLRKTLVAAASSEAFVDPSLRIYLETAKDTIGLDQNPSTPDRVYYVGSSLDSGSQLWQDVDRSYCAAERIESGDEDEATWIGKVIEPLLEAAIRYSFSTSSHKTVPPSKRLELRTL